MDFELTEEQAALREVSRAMLAANCPPQLVRSLASAGAGIDEKLWQRAADLGWTGLVVPGEHDGAGQGLVELCLVAEEIGRAAAPGPFTDTALIALAAARFHAGPPGDSAGRARLVTALALGTAKASWAHHGRVTAVRDGEELVLSGRATAVQAAGSADWLLVTAQLGTVPLGTVPPGTVPPGNGRPEPTGGDNGSCLVLVQQSRASVQARRTIDETRRWHDVALDGVRVRATDVVTADAAQVQWLTDAAAVLTAADALGVGERLLEMSTRHVKVREQFGRPLGSFQSVKHKLADMLTTLKGARAATYYAAMALDAGVQGASAAASAAKAFTGEGVAALAGEALQVHGGIGFTWEHDLHLYLRRAKVDEMLYGAPAEHYERLVWLRG